MRGLTTAVFRSMARSSGPQSGLPRIIAQVDAHLRRGGWCHNRPSREAAMTGADGFSLTNCGPVDRALARIGLKSRDPPHLYFRAFVPAALIWLPLLGLALLGQEDGAEATVSFFEDFSTHVRFLVVVPLLVIADAPIGRRTGIVMAHFVNATLITSADRARFDALIRRTGQALQSNVAELLIVFAAGLFVIAAIQNLTADGVTFWLEQPAAAGPAGLTAAGWWYALWSWLPLFLFLRWLWRYLVWCWLLALTILGGIAPLAAFWRPLRIAKEAAVLNYGSFLSRYVQGFQRRWIGTRAGEQPFDEYDDICPLADIGAAFERIDTMRVVPVALKTAVAFALAGLLPLLPLLLTQFPLRELVKLLMQLMI